MAMYDEFTMPFGKYKGRPFAEVPVSYLQWCLDNMQLYHNTRKEIKTHLESRLSEEANTGQSRANLAHPKTSTPKNTEDFGHDDIPF